MRIAFVTCVQLGLSCMEAIYEQGGQLTLAFTLHDHLAVRKSGRVWIDDFCHLHSLPLVKLRHVNDGELADAVRRYEIDWLFIVGWSQIASKDVLSSPRKGVLGMHPTLLPEGRGRASIPWAILKRLRQTGVTLFKLDEGVDTGLIVSQEVVPVAPDETATTLYEKISHSHVSLIRSSLQSLVDSSVVFRRQDESLATVWPARRPEDGVILNSMTVAQIDLLVRALTHPYPGAYWDDQTTRTVIWKGSSLYTHGAIPIPAIDGCYWATEFFQSCITS